MVSKIAADYSIIGNLALLSQPLMALFCSPRYPGGLILQTYDLARELRDAGAAIIGGFQTPMERECLRLLLRGMQPLVICPARGIAAMRIPASYRPALADGRLLVASAFPPWARRATADLAGRRNEFVRSRAARIIIAYAAPGGSGQPAAADPGQPGQRQPPGTRRAAHNAGSLDIMNELGINAPSSRQAARIRNMVEPESRKAYSRLRRRRP